MISYMTVTIVIVIWQGVNTITDQSHILQL